MTATIAARAGPAPRRLFLEAAIEQLSVVVAVLLLLFVGYVPVSLLMHGYGDLDAAAGPTRLVNFACYGLAAIGLAMRRHSLPRIGGAAWFALALVGLAFVTTLWSIDPGLTLRRAVTLAGTFLIGCYLASFPLSQLVRIVAKTILFAAAAGIALAILMPTWGRMVDTHVGAYRGLWPHKNVAGFMLAMGFVALIGWTSQARSLLPFALGAPFLFALGLWANSSTALACMMLAMAAIGAVWVVRQGPITTTIAVTGLAIVAAVALVLGALVIEVVAGALGRDMTLTGRTEVWAALWQRIGAEPITGYGFGAFWDVEDGPVAAFNAQVAYAPGSAHNSWLDVWLQLGVFGVVLTAMFMLTLAWGVARTAIEPGSRAHYLWPFLVVAFACSATESFLVEPNTFLWTMLIAASLILAQRRPA
jgi:O-antigen ligase